MFNTIINIFKIEDLRKKILFTIGVLIVYRIGIQLTVPGIDPIRLIELHGSNRSAGTLADFLNLFSGGARENASIFSLGVMPYITSSIIMQLLTAIIPSFERMVKEGPEGRKKFHQYGRMGTVIVCLIQGFMFGQGLLAENQGTGLIVINSFLFLVLFTLAVTSGTMVLMWLGEQITEKGIGNGISLIIMAGIIARLPHSLYRLFLGVDKGSLDPMNLLIILAMFVVVVGLVVFEEKGLRKIPIQYANRAIGGGRFGTQFSYLPFKVNPTGVIPIIFASSLLIFPSQLSLWFGNKIPVFQKIAVLMMPGNIGYNIAYFLLILFFAYFYMEIELNPHDIAENLRKSGGFIPGIRPGQKTEEYISFILTRITFPGAIFLGIIALLPYFVIKNLNVPSDLGYLMGGTSLLIMVGVALDTLKQIESQLMMHNLGGFLNKKGKI